jgi:hypothetical protein
MTSEQIHSARAYYWDHKDALDQDIARRRAHTDELRRTTSPSPLLVRLKLQENE